MTAVTVIGAEGFVGSAFCAYLSGRSGLAIQRVTRQNYADVAGRRSDVAIDCSGNSRKYLAEEVPVEEFGLSVTQRLRTLLDFPAALQVHVSSVDVYSALDSPETTREDSLIDLSRTSHYGFHKLVAEDVVRHYAPRWLILRPAGMVGPGLRKNPVYDVLHGQALRIHPDSQYQFMDTRDLARIAWGLVDRGASGEVFNLCGEGLISPREVARLAGRDIDLTLLPAGSSARIVNVNIDKIKSVVTVPSTPDAVLRFVRDWRQGPGER